MAKDQECIRCGEAPSADEDGYCVRCHQAVRAEVEEGFSRLSAYLAHWAEYDAWCRGQDAPSAPLPPTGFGWPPGTTPPTIY